jgi:hypothetical protein
VATFDLSQLIAPERRALAHLARAQIETSPRHLAAAFTKLVSTQPARRLTTAERHALAYITRREIGLHRNLPPQLELLRTAFAKLWPADKTPQPLVTPRRSRR